MTTALSTSPPPNSTETGGLLTRWKDVPPWVIIAIIAATLVAGYLIYTQFSSKSSGTGSSKKWESQAFNFLESQGYPNDTSREAISNYVNGQTLTPSQITLVAAAIGSVGTPPNLASSPTTTAQITNAPSSGPQVLGGGTSAVSGGGSGSSTSYPGTGNSTSDDSTVTTSYWFVPVGVAGWSTTFAGIANQFGTATAQQLQTLNPNLSSTTYGRIPVGSTIKVPRSVSS